MRRDSALTLTGVALAAVLAAIITGGAISTTTVRSMFGVPLELVLPGYALAEVIFPRRSLGMPGRLIAAFGFSLAVTVLGGVALNWTPWGLRAESLAAVLGSVTVVACGFALMRRRAGGRESSPLRPASTLTVRDRVLIGLGLAAVTGAFILASTGASQVGTRKFTQFWILPVDGSSPPAVRIGIENHEGATVAYRVRLMTGSTIIQEWGSIEVTAGTRWEVTLAVPVGVSGAPVAEALLYRLDRPDAIYRRVMVQLRA